MNIYSIAEECNVSVATVSRVINGRDGVSEKTRARVLAAMESNDFKPKISRNNNNTVCMFIANAIRQTSDILSPYIKEFANGMGGELFERDQVFAMMPMKHMYASVSDFTMFCKQQGFSGAVIVNLAKNNPMLNWEIKDFPVVFVGAGPEGCRGGAYSVNVQNRDGACEATRYLLGMGHRRIAHITADLGVFDHIERVEGYKKALEEAGVPFDSRLVVDLLNYDERGYRSAIRRLLDGPDGVTALFAGDDFEAFRVRALLDEWGIKVPDQVSIVGFDDYDYSGMMTPPLTTVRQPIRQLGALTARLVMGLEPTGERFVTLPTQLIVRESVKDLCGGQGRL